MIKGDKTRKIRAGITVFPGSNCDFDVYYALSSVFHMETSFIWHKDAVHDYKKFDFIVIPGGFSYGDYLRAGALAARSAVMDSLMEFSERGGIILGICNGFQILLESGLLNGVMLPNNSLKFECKDVYLRTLNFDTPFTCAIPKSDDGKDARLVLRMPIAHHDGNFFARADDISGFEKNNSIIFKYSDADGKTTDASNPNGSMHNIAGISNKKFNVMGLMPHPERSSEKILGSEDGGYIFRSVIEYLNGK